MTTWSVSFYVKGANQIWNKLWTTISFQEQQLKLKEKLSGEAFMLGVKSRS